MKHRWTYFLRTLPDIEALLEPLERAIGNVLIPAMTGLTCTPAERELLAVRLGGLGLANPCRNATKEYEASIRVTEPLVKKKLRYSSSRMMMIYGNCRSTTEGRMINILEKG